MADRPAPGASVESVSAELIANRGFAVSRRGFEQDEVKEFLELVAGAVRSLHHHVERLEADLADAEHRVANPKLDEDTLLRMVGEETGSILRSARAAATEMSAVAERQTAELRAVADRESGAVREAAARDAAELQAEAERVSTEMRTAAETESASVREAAATESAALRQAAESETAALRQAAEFETAALRQAAESETAEQRSSAQADSAAMRESAERDTTELRSRAEAEAAKVVDDARQLAGDLRTEAESVLERSTEEAEQVVARIRATAQDTANQLVERARSEAETMRSQAEQDRKLTVEGAQAVREKILDDLTRRRRVASTQIEQLRAGRERLLVSYGVVRRTLEEVNDELHRADAEAREAASAAGRAFEEGPDDVEVPDLLFAPSTGGGADDQADDIPAADIPAAEIPAAEIPDADIPAAEIPDAIFDPPDLSPPGAPAPPEPAPAPAEAIPAEVSVPARADADAEVTVTAAEESGRATAGVVDDLFARLRAGRQDAVAHARVVLEEPDLVTVAAAPALLAAAAEVTTVPKGAAAPGLALVSSKTPPVSRDEDLEPPRSDEEEAWLEGRDQLLDKTETALTRKLKRALQDEQNDLLDRLRSLRGRPTPDSLLPSVAEQSLRFSLAASVLVEQGAQRGSQFAVGVLSEQGSPAGLPATPATVADLTDELAGAIVVPLRRRLEQTVEESGEDDQAVLVEALGGAYREWKTQRIERIAGDTLAAAFARGVLAATPERGTLRWVADDIDGPCSDCDDNVLAGALPKNEAFPTGQEHPPAHAGCRCLLVPGS